MAEEKTGPAGGEAGGEAPAPGTLEALSEPAREIVKTRRMQGRYRVKELMELLHEVERHDLEVEKIKSAQSWRAFWIFVVVAVGVSTLLFSTVPEREMPGLIKIFLSLFPAVFIAGIYKVFASSGMASVDVEDELRTLVLPVMRGLKQDVPPGERLQFSLDLRALGSRGGRGGPGPSPWLEVTLPLADGCQLGFELSDRLSYRPHRKKRFKDKYARLSVARLLLTAPEGSFGWDQERLQGLGQRYSIKPKAAPGRSGYRLTNKVKAKTRGSAPGWPFDEDRLLAMAMELYSALRPRTRAA